MQSSPSTPRATSELTFVGHSQGGGEAAANSYATGRNALTFNAAGVSRPTLIYNLIKEQKNSKLAKSRIMAYINPQDVLSGVQNATLLPPATDGTKIYVNPERRTDNPLYNHSLDSMLPTLLNDAINSGVPIFQKTFPDVKISGKKPKPKPSKTPICNDCWAD